MSDGQASGGVNERSKARPVPAVQPSTQPVRQPQPKEPISPNPSTQAAYRRQAHPESLRNAMSPAHRIQRHPSFSQQAVQELVNNPPSSTTPNPEFSGRDWRTIGVDEVTEPDDLKFVELDTTVEDASKLLAETHGSGALLIRRTKDCREAVGTFEYSDLTAYLLFVVGLNVPEDGDGSALSKLAQRGREGKPVALREIEKLSKKDPFTSLPRTAGLTKAVELFGSGIHRIVITESRSEDVIGVLSQIQLVNFFWVHGRHFSALEPLFSRTLGDLAIGSHAVYAINGDRPVTEALELMHSEGISSVPVLDNQTNVIGNISHVDVRLLTKSSSLPLLRSTCVHFTTTILSERGLNEGKDTFPVFHVTRFSTLAHTIAKLVATRSHRLWVVEAASPASSQPQTPATTPTILVPPSHPTPLSLPMPSHALPAFHHTKISASTFDCSSLSGRLNGIVSLTDILNLFARASGLSPTNPDETRRHRRRSSSSSIRHSAESAKASSFDVAAGAGKAVPGRR